MYVCTLVEFILVIAVQVGIEILFGNYTGIYTLSLSKLSLQLIASI